jgi:hypothetical protein
MKYLLLVLTIAMAVVLAGAELPAGQTALRGKIVQRPDQEPVIQTADGKQYTVGGDEFTLSQMKDDKLNGRDIELEGRFSGSNKFEALKIFTIKNGKRYIVTYWCEICSIRTHKAGRCMCCQGETELQELPEGQDRPSL